MDTSKGLLLLPMLLAHLLGNGKINLTIFFNLMPLITPLKQLLVDILLFLTHNQVSGMELGISYIKVTQPCSRDTLEQYPILNKRTGAQGRTGKSNYSRRAVRKSSTPLFAGL